MIGLELVDGSRYSMSGNDVEEAGDKETLLRAPEKNEATKEGFLDVVWDRRVMSVCVATMCLMLGLGMTNPIVPAFAMEDLGGSAWSVGVSFSVFGLARLLLNVPMGWAADAVGRKPVLCFGCACTALGTGLSAVAPNITLFIITRAIAGAGNSCYLGTAMVYLADHATPRTRARVLGANQFALLIGVSLGPALGGLCARAFGNRPPFLLIAALSSAAALWTQLAVPAGTSTKKKETSRAEIHRVITSLLVDPRFVSVAACQFSTFALRQGGRNLVLAFIATSRFGYDPGSLGALYAGMSLADLVFLFPAATAADLAPDRRFVAVPSLSLTALAVASLGLVAHSPSHSALIATVTLWALSHAFLGPTLPAFAADISPPAHRALSLALFRSGGDLGTLLAPTALGLVIDFAGPATASLALAGFVLLTALSFALVGSKNPPSGAAAGGSSQQ